MFFIRFIIILNACISIAIEHEKIKRKHKTREEFGKYLRKKLESLGPSFIKVGQILSLRPDLIPIEYCIELRGLLDRTEEITFETVLNIMKDELGQNPSKVFSHISKLPIGSASLAQVHKGRIKNSDEFVAIKVRKPGVEKIIRTDLYILKILNTIFYRFINQYINSNALIEDLENIFEKEINFVKEGSNIEKFKEMFNNISYVTTPKVYWKLTTEKLLVMEFIPGTTLNKVFNKIDRNPKLKSNEKIKINGIIIEKKKLAEKLIHITALSVFKFGFFHADPHPANIILTYEGRLAYIDFGMVGDLINSEKVIFREIVYCIAVKDEEKILKLLIEYNRSIGIMPPDNTILQGLKHFMHTLLSDFVASDQNNFPISKLLYSLGDMTFKFHFPPPQFIMLIAKQIFTLEGLAYYLMPDLNVVNEFKPYVSTYKAHDSFNKLSNEKLVKFLDDSISLALNLPETVNSIINNIKEEGMIRIPERTNKNIKFIFIILTLYLLLFSIALSQYLKYYQDLIFVIAGSIIAEIFILYLFINKDKK